MNAYSGTYRIKFDVKYATGTGGNTAQVYRNGVAKGTLRTPTTTYVTYSEDLSGWSAGDDIQIYLQAANGGTVYIRNFIISTNAYTVVVD